MADGPISTGLMRGIDLALTKRQIGLREQELAQQEQRLKAQEKWNKINTYLGVLNADKQPEQMYDEALQGIMSEMGITGMDFTGRVKEARQESLGIKDALEKNKDPKVATYLLQRYANKYRGFPKAQQEFAQTAQELQQLRLTEADQEISQRLSTAKTPQEQIGMLTQMQLTGNEFTQAVAKKRLDALTAQKDILGVKKETTPKTLENVLAERVMKGELTLEKALELKKKGSAEGEGITPTKIRGQLLTKYLNKQKLTDEEKTVLQKELADPLFGVAVRIIQNDINLASKPAEEQSQAIFNLYERMKQESGGLLENDQESDPLGIR